ncbi:MAG: hypothetical protein KKE16_00455 [Firmicutes bacterium]|nr:hypothetical protein [Bacillota bacterium]
MNRQILALKCILILGVITNIVLNIAALSVALSGNPVFPDNLGRSTITDFIWLLDIIISLFLGVVIFVLHRVNRKLINQNINSRKVIIEAEALFILCFAISIGYRFLNDLVNSSEILSYSGPLLSSLMIVYILIKYFLYKNDKHSDEKSLQFEENRLYMPKLQALIHMFMFVILISIIDISLFKSEIPFYLLYSVIMLFWFFQMSVILQPVLKGKLFRILDISIILTLVIFVVGYFINESLFWLLVLFVVLIGVFLRHQFSIAVTMNSLKAIMMALISYLFAVFINILFFRPIFINGTLNDGNSWYFLLNYNTYINLFSAYAIYLCGYIVLNTLVFNILLTNQNYNIVGYHDAFVDKN